MKAIVLASSSPRRSELLQKHGIPFTIDYQNIEEVLDKSLTLSKRLEKVAIEKGQEVAKRHPDEIVISADTMVCLHGNMLGKPSTRNHAKEMLEQQSGQQQVVYTAVAIFDGGKVTSYCDQTKVLFKELSKEQIEAYLDSDEWQGKAGAYAIQGLGKALVKEVNGDMETVIGLPVRIIEDYLHTQKWQ